MANYEATKYDFNASNLTGIEGINTGIIVPWSSASVPTGFLECNGANVSRSTYSGLFAVVGTTYGSGDGSSTFGLPDLQNNVALGRSNNKSLAQAAGAEQVASAGTVSIANTTISEANLPPHRHPGGAGAAGGGNFSPQISAGMTGNTGNAGQDGAHNHSCTFSGSATSVLQPYVTVLYIIKT